jgi:hypothetical protein
VARGKAKAAPAPNLRWKAEKLLSPSDTLIRKKIILELLGISSTRAEVFLKNESKTARKVGKFWFVSREEVERAAKNGILVPQKRKLDPAHLNPTLISKLPPGKTSKIEIEFENEVLKGLTQVLQLKNMDLNKWANASGKVLIEEFVKMTSTLRIG